MRTLVKYLKCERENCERLGQTFFEEEAKKRYFEEEKIFKKWETHLLEEEAKKEEAKKEEAKKEEAKKEEAKKEEVVKRPRGRPKKNSPPVIKEKKKKGRPRKYEEGYNDHTFVKVLVDRKEYYRLLEIEKKYLEIKNTIILERV